MLASFAGAGGAVLLLGHCYPIFSLFLRQVFVHDRILLNGNKYRARQTVGVCAPIPTLPPRGKDVICTKRRNYWFFVPLSSLRPPSPAYGGRDFLCRLRDGAAAKRDKTWAFQRSPSGAGTDFSAIPVCVARAGAQAGRFPAGSSCRVSGRRCRCHACGRPATVVR